MTRGPPAIPLFLKGVRTSVCLIPQAGLASPAPSLPIGARGERYRAGHEGWGHSHAVMCVRGQGSASQVEGSSSPGWPGPMTRQSGQTNKLASKDACSLC